MIPSFLAFGGQQPRGPRLPETPASGGMVMILNHLWNPARPMPEKMGTLTDKCHWEDKMTNGQIHP
jgi:hypothetical protein